MALYLMRHGPTAYNEGQKRLRGWIDLPLADDARPLIEKNVQCLAKVPLVRAVASDLHRAHDTACIALEALDKDKALRPFAAWALRPWNVGELAGEVIEDGIEDMEFLIAHPDLPAPGGESWNVFLDRWREALSRLLAYAASRDVLGVTHHRNLLSLPFLLGQSREIKTTGPPDPAGIVRVCPRTFRTEYL